MNMRVISDQANIFSMAGQLLVEKLQEWLSEEQQVILFLSGGSVVSVYSCLKEYIQHDLTISLSKNLALAQVDERFLGPSSVTSFANDVTTAGKEGLDELGNADVNAEVIGATGLWDVCKEKGIPYYLISQKKTLEGSASEYVQTISNIWAPGTKTMAVLGIGEDGHTAGLLPEYQSVWDMPELFVGYKNNSQFPQRISLTPTALRRLDFALVVAAGEKKRAVLGMLLSSPFFDSNQFPAGIFHEMKEVEICTDQHNAQ